MDPSQIARGRGERGMLPAPLLAMFAAIAIWSAACSSKSNQPNLASIQISPAAPGSCLIDAVKMCQATGGVATAVPQQVTTPMAGSYGSSNMPDSIEFQIPAGQAIKLMCYFNTQHTAIYRADATADSALTTNSVDYMKKRGFCTNK